MPKGVLIAEDSNAFILMGKFDIVFSRSDASISNETGRPMNKPIWNTGSEWHRWDPHLHVPGTLFNDQFKGDWAGVLSAVENASPTVEALGITDYCVLNGYKEFRKRWEAGRASNVRFIFPNIEFRLSVETERKKGINLHLLFCPDDPDHVAKIEHALSYLTFTFRGTTYECVPERLVALGRAVDASLAPEKALEKGAQQFKVSPEHIRKLLNEDAWAADNCLIAVVASERDGTAGLKNDTAFDALQEEINARAHIVFSATPSDREFWLGRKPGFNREFLEKTYGGLKPCLHGSDAHEVTKVLKPDQDRYCWIRSELSFTGLKQTLLEPDLRVAIGPQVPSGPAPSETIRSLVVTDAPWLGTTTVELNDGLVAIIGPKGSGKTALADMLADVAGASIEDGSAFLLKAKEHLDGESAELIWRDSTRTGPSRLADAGLRPSDDPTYVRYLSQQSVERLCSSDSLGRELLAEIEGVVFASIPEGERHGASGFAELRGVRLEQTLRARTDHLETIQRLSEAIAKEDENKTKRPLEEKRFAELTGKITKDEKDLAELLPKDKKRETEQLTKVQAALEARNRELQQLNLRMKKLGELEKEYQRRAESWQKQFGELQQLYATCDLTPAEWSILAISFAPEIRRTEMFTAAKARVTALVKTATDGTAISENESDLSKVSLKYLQERQEALTKAIGIEAERAKQHTGLARRVATAKQEREKLERELLFLQEAETRRKTAIDERRSVYAAVFETLVEEHAVLDELYAPLKAQLATESGVEKSLEFYVRRRVDTESWVRAGEGLLDLRTAGEFRGHGALAKAAQVALVPAWKTGGATEVAAAMDQFIGAYMRDLMAAKRSDVPLQDLGRWLFSTDHVTLEYGIKYDGVDITRLSPGLRGIVLLMLYLAVDQWDTRPLLVDQPEENLDPHSVYEELVKYFRAAKRRRQVILVTHNPNLVVNADADQVIIASAERTDPNYLPTISYTSGGLEDKTTRFEVCRILEGGERAFLERERRYAIPRNLRKNI
jgi:energy-coupling factor transporter ATP-binding protein EcfA2